MTPQGPDVTSQIGIGGMPFKGPWGLSVASNITSKGMGHYSDAALKTVITTSVRPVGSRLKPLMGVPYYARMSASDLDALVTYLRSLPPKCGSRARTGGRAKRAVSDKTSRQRTTRSGGSAKDHGSTGAGAPAYGPHTHPPLKEQAMSNPMISSDRVEGTDVYNQAGDKIGSIDCVMIDKLSGQTRFAVMDFGGFLGMGTEQYPLPWSMLKYDTVKEGYVVPVDKAQLENAPKHEREDRPDYSDEYGRRVHDHYGVAVY